MRYTLFTLWFLGIRITYNISRRKGVGILWSSVAALLWPMVLWVAIVELIMLRAFRVMEESVIADQHST